MLILVKVVAILLKMRNVALGTIFNVIFLNFILSNKTYFCLF